MNALTHYCKHAVIALVFPLMLALGTASAAPGGWAPGPSGFVPQQSDPFMHTARRALSLDQAVKQVRKKTGGRVLSAETIEKDGRRVHRIKVLNDGKVRVHYVDADS